jgi:CheY-like chemotaxis protein
MKKILIADDDPTVRDFLKTKLNSSGRFTVFTAGGGKEAFRMAETERPDLVLCDVDMPDMDGGAVAAEMAGRNTTKHIPIIFVSGLVTPEEVASGASAGRWPVMSKRSQFPDLLKLIDEVLSRWDR